MSITRGDLQKDLRCILEPYLRKIANATGDMTTLEEILQKLCDLLDLLSPLGDKELTYACIPSEDCRPVIVSVCYEGTTIVDISAQYLDNTPFTGDPSLIDFSCETCREQVDCQPDLCYGTGAALPTCSGHTLDIIKPECCAIAVTIDGNTVPLGVGKAAICFNFDCPVTLDAIAVTSGDCTLDEVEAYITKKR